MTKTTAKKTYTFAQLQSLFYRGKKHTIKFSAYHTTLHAEGDDLVVAIAKAVGGTPVEVEVIYEDDELFVAITPSGSLSRYDKRVWKI